MPQNPIVPRPGGALSALDVSAATAIKTSPGTLVRITVLAVATGGTFGAYDAATTGAAATANAIVQYASGYPAVGSVITLEWPCNTGIVVNPGTGGAVSVSYA
ncbi:hypothetical protein [Burkholderia gladioli]|uniref:hypothetical protein n=1 Tax=Burkholderia gladioli TaxID=28095 RepID=UPI001FC7CC2F|nr:hypothetical protein [Burkholderia gladioli]